MRSRDLTTSCGWATSKGDDGSLVAPTLFAGTRLMLPTSTKARVYIGITFLGGLLSLSLGLLHGEWTEPSRYICYLALALLASGMKVSLPGVHGTMSVIFLFILIGVRELTLAQTLLMGVLGTVIQCYWKAKTWPKPIQVAFNIASMASAVAGTYYLFHSRVSQIAANNQLLMLVAAASTFFVLNTAPVACVISLTEQKPLRKVWSECYFWSFPYYLLGAAIAGIVELLDKKTGWQSSLLILPVVYLIFRSYRLYLARLEAERNHAEGMAALHLRTIEALALAIEAKDHSTHEHLRRVQVYAVSIGKEMGLSESDLEALRAAAVLHDIGKLAVPEHIISKPGRLTPEEFERMKIHPLVGAEILERVQFPYPVVPIVRAHHERWDGNGYPCGLRGQEIPTGARILAVVDCLDGLASDRQYRPALPLDKAMEHVIGEAGKSFDPKVVEVLQGRYRELELLANVKGGEQTRLSRKTKVDNGTATGAGFEKSDSGPITPGSSSIDFLTCIAAARHEMQMLFELNRTAPRSDRPAIALFKSRSWSCSAIHFDVSGQSGLFATLDVCQKLEFAVTPMKHFHDFWVEALSGFSNDVLHGFFQWEGRTILTVRCKSVEAVNHCEDSRTGRNFLPAQSARITIPIPPLVVGAHNRNDRIRE